MLELAKGLPAGAAAREHRSLIAGEQSRDPHAACIQ
jgi:hypothetical protein